MRWLPCAGRSRSGDCSGARRGSFVQSTDTGFGFCCRFPLGSWTHQRVQFHGWDQRSGWWASSGYVYREHFYQRLVRSGKTHTFVTGIEIGLQLVILVLMIGYVRYESVPVRIGLIITVISIWIGFFYYAELMFRKSNTKSAN